jgi:hypothetical protein
MGCKAEPNEKGHQQFDGPEIPAWLVMQGALVMSGGVEGTPVTGRKVTAGM